MVDIIGLFLGQIAGEKSGLSTIWLNRNQNGFFDCQLAPFRPFCPNTDHFHNLSIKLFSIANAQCVFKQEAIEIQEEQ